MSTIAASPPPKTFPRRRQWLIPSAIVASLLIAWVGKILLFPPKPSAAELASLEVFLENTWDDVDASSEPGDTEFHEFDNPVDNPRK